MIPPPPGSTLFPYTTLFRSGGRMSGPRLLTRIGRGYRCRSALPRVRHVTQRSPPSPDPTARSEEHTSELQSRFDLVCRLLLEKKKKKTKKNKRRHKYTHRHR